jgi:hypothetical protein
VENGLRITAMGSHDGFIDSADIVGSESLELPNLLENIDNQPSVIAHLRKVSVSVLIRSEGAYTDSEQIINEVLMLFRKERTSVNSASLKLTNGLFRHQ